MTGAVFTRTSGGSKLWAFLKASTNEGPRLRWLVADLNSYFASCEQQENPDLRGKPIAVAPLLSNTTCAIAASYEAKAYGVKTGRISAKPGRCALG